MDSAKGNVPVGPTPPTPESETFFDKIGPGGKYYKYSQIGVVVTALTFLTLLVLILLPYLTGGKYQNSVSKLFGNVPIKYEQKVLSAQKRIYPLAKGEQTWRVSRGTEVRGPAMQTVVVDNLSPASDTPQKVTVTIKNDAPVTKVTATIFTDNQRLNQDMKLSSGTATDGTWTTSWKITDTDNYIYHITFDLFSSSGNWSGTLSIR